MLLTSRDNLCINSTVWTRTQANTKLQDIYQLGRVQRRTARMMVVQKRGLTKKNWANCICLIERRRDRGWHDKSPSTWKAAVWREGTDGPFHIQKSEGVFQTLHYVFMIHGLLILKCDLPISGSWNLLPDLVLKPLILAEIATWSHSPKFLGTSRQEWKISQFKSGIQCNTFSWTKTKALSTS